MRYVFFKCIPVKKKGSSRTEQKRQDFFQDKNNDDNSKVKCAYICASNSDAYYERTSLFI